MKQLKHMCVAECSIHFRPEGLPASKMRRCVDYMAVQDVVSAHPSFKNVVKNVPCLSVNGVV